MDPSQRAGYCYFCNQTIDRYNEQGHISTCGSVLEPCPNKCGSYVQRKMKRDHMQECANKTLRSRPGTLERPSHKHKTNMQYSVVPNTIQNDQKPMQQLQNDLWRLGANLNKNESNFKQMATAVEAIRKEQMNTRTSKASWESQRKLEIDKLNLQYQMILEWKKQIVELVESSKNLVTENGAKCRASENHIQNRLVILDQLMMDVNLLRQNLSDEQRFRQEAASMWRAELDDFKAYFSQENAMIGALWSDQNKGLQKVNDNLSDVQGSVVDLTTKHHTLVFEVKGHTKSLVDIEDSIALHTKELNEFRRTMAQLQNDFAAFEENSSKGTILSQTPGKLLWKITNYQSKMEQAKESDVFLKSPVFYSHEYGYKIRVEVFLNGIKKWKGRHLIASLRVLKGDFDPLLAWPCNIEGSITLRDQTAGFDVKNFKKFISAKRQTANEDNEEPQESSTQYIFISHSTLSKNKYINNDSLYLEIEVSANNNFSATHLNGQTLV